jgi:hypothetical protein
MWYKIWLQIKSGKANCSSFEQTWPRPFIGDECLLIIVSFLHPTFLINALSCLPPSIPFSGFRLPRLRCSLVSIAGMARDPRGGSARRRPRGHNHVRLPRCCPPPPPREWGSVVMKRSRPSAPPPCVLLSAPWKRSVLHQPGGGSRTCVQGPS